MPPYPPQVLATFSLKYQGPLAPSHRFRGSFYLKPLTSIGPYRGTIVQGTDQLQLTWHWAQGQPTAYATGIFTVGIYADTRNWTTHTVPPNPYLRYESHNLVPTAGNLWLTVLVITA